jgi:hypothetical protein
MTHATETLVTSAPAEPVVTSGCFIGPKLAQVRKPSAFGHVLQGQGDSGVDSLGVHFRRQHGIGEIHGLRLLTYEQNTRHLTLPRGCASFAATAEAREATCTAAP